MSVEPPGAEAFERFALHRRRLLSVAYRLTGSIADAEDCVQDAWIRWQRADRADVLDDEAFLVRTVSRLALDRLSSAPRRRERYVGPWLPDPLVRSVTDRAGAGAVGDPEDAAVIADEVTFALMVVLDRLTPDERTSLVLHDVFDVPFADIATLLHRSVDSTRQLASRARARVRHDPDAPRRVTPPDTDAMTRILGAFASGDIDTVAALFSDDVTLTSDGGPDRHAARHAIVGPGRVARLLVNLGRRELPSARDIEIVDVNGAPAIWMGLPDGPAVMTFDLDESGYVRRVWTLLNPDKIRRDPWPAADRVPDGG